MHHHDGSNNEVTENPKGTLQERVLALGLGIQAKQIRYWEKKVRGDQWQCTLDVAGGGRYKSNPKGSKKTANTRVAKMALADWNNIEKVLRRQVNLQTRCIIVQEQEATFSKPPSEAQAAQFLRESFGATSKSLPRIKPMEPNVSAMYEQAGRLLLQAVSLALDARSVELKGEKAQQNPRDAM